MTSLFARVFKQAKLTFDQNNVESFKANFNNLKSLVDHLTITDINLDPVITTREAFMYPDRAPCTYVEIFENPQFTMSVFVLKENYTMPLHDHPMMHGLLKVLSGTVRIQSYTEIERVDHQSGQSIVVEAEEPKILDSVHEGCATLTPTHSNYHEITAIGGPAAFFDILSPPYHIFIPLYGKRMCSFYDKLLQPGYTNKFVLMKIPTPAHYDCDEEQYTAPEFMVDDSSNENKEN